MPANIAHRFETRLVIVLCAVFCAYSIIPASFHGPIEIFRAIAASSETTTIATGDQTVVRKTNLRANDIVVDPNTQTLYVTVPSDDIINGNKIAPLNPSNGAIGTAVFVGSDPNKMVISDNGQFIYVNLDGASGIRRFDVTNQSAGLHIRLGFNSSGEPLELLDFAVQPGHPGTVAISRNSFGNSSVGIFDDGVQRPGTATPGTRHLVFNTTNPSRLYGLGSTFASFIQRYDVSSNGITSGSTTSIPLAGPTVFSNGRLYLSTGRVFDAESGTSVGTFTGAPFSNVTPLAVDQNVQRAYFLTSTTSSTTGTGTATIHVFDTQTFGLIGSINIPNVVGVPAKLVRWGTNGLAFCSTGGVAYIIQTTLVPSADPIPTPTPTPTSSPTPSPTPPVEPSFVRVLSLSASDLIYDPFGQRLYASTPSLAGSIGNSVLPIDPVDGSLGTAIPVGSEPNKLARSDDGQFLYVGLDGSNSVRRVDLSSQTASIQFSLGHNAVFGTPNLAADIEVAPGNAHEVAVAMRSAFGSPSHQGVAIFDDGVSRGPVDRSQTQSNVIEFSSTATQLFGLDTDTSAQSKFRKMSVTPTGIGSTQAYSLFLASRMEYDNGRVYTNVGVVVDPELPAKVGTFNNPIGSGRLVLPDSSVGRTFFITGADASNSNTPQANVQISAFDQNTFLPVGVVNISGVVGGVRSFVRWGVNGLAFSTNSGQVFLVQTSLVSSSTPVPTPTPTPSPNPSPSPIPTPGVGELVQISLPTNDLAVDPVTHTIFASVPSGSANNPNSLMPIDPLSGSLGTAIPVGNNPNKLAISDNGSLIYVSLDGSNSIRQVDVPSRQAGVEFSLGSDPVSGPYQVEDLSVAPNHPETVAVARFKPNTSPRSGGVVVYDNGILRGSTIPIGANNRIEFSRSEGVLYGQNNDDNFDFRFRKIGVASCGAQTLVATENLFRGFGLDFEVDNGRAYSSSGIAIDPEAGTITGVFKLRAVDDFFAPPALIAPEVKARRIYFLVTDGSSTVLRVYDTSTFLKVGELLIPGVSGTASSLVRWGTNGLAFRTSNGQVFLLQHNLIGGSDPQFVPGPIPGIPTTQIRVHMIAPLGDPAGFTISLGGGLSLSAVTNASGDVTFPNVPICAGNVTVTPSKAGFVFAPASITVSNPVNANLEFTSVLSLVGFAGATDRSVSESVNKVNFTVTRNNNFPTPTTLTFETVPGTASDRSDFNTTTGVIVFGPGETQKSFSVLVTDDTHDEPNETFIVRLKDPIGGELVSSAAAINITILDNDSDPNPPNPLFNAAFLVRQHYQDFLSRAATDDPAGFSFWTNEITMCNSESDPVRKSECLAVKRINVSAAFFLSIEFQQTGYLVHRFYTSSFPVKPSRPLGLPRMMEFLRDTQAIGSGVVVGASGWEAKLEQNKQTFALSWVARDEFIADHALNQSAEEFVDSLFQNNGVSPTSLERSSAINAFGSGGAAGRANALRTVAESQSVAQKQNNPAFVLMQYFGYLRRNPDDAPDGNFSGYQFWLNKLNQFNGNFVNAEMVKAFLVSGEYQQRFGSANFDISQ